jgi:hypothetical protein
MRATYAQIEILSARANRPDRAPAMPLLGFLSGVAVAVPLWFGVAWLFCRLFG